MLWRHYSEFLFVYSFFLILLFLLPMYSSFSLASLFSDTCVCGSFIVFLYLCMWHVCLYISLCMCVCVCMWVYVCVYLCCIFVLCVFMCVSYSSICTSLSRFPLVWCGIAPFIVTSVHRSFNLKMHHHYS